MSDHRVAASESGHVLDVNDEAFASRRLAFQLTRALKGRDIQFLVVCD
jgi:hypothetical protein